MRQRKMNRILTMLTVFALFWSIMPMLAFAEEEQPAVNPVLSGIEISADMRSIYLYSDVDLKAGAIDESKIKLTVAGRPLNATQFVTTIEGTKTLRLSLTAGLAGSCRLQLDAGAVKSDATNDDNAPLTERTLTITPRFPTKIKDMVASIDNKSVAIELDTTGLSNPTIAKSDLAESLKSMVNIALDGRNYVALGTNDTVSYDNNTKKMTVNFESALTSNTARLRIAAGALAMSVGSGNNELLNPTYITLAIDLTPLGVSATVSPDNKTVTVKYGENIKNASPARVKQTMDAELKQKVTFAANGTTFNPLGLKDAVVIKGDSVVVTFESAITGTSNRLRIGADAVMDLKNRAPEYTTVALSADTTPPNVIGVGYDSNTKKITVFFNENIALFGSTTNSVLAGSLRYNTDKQITGARVAISNHILIISQNTTDITDADKIENLVIPADRLRDLANNKMAAVTTIAADGIGPSALPTLPVPIGLSNSGRDLTITFNEPIFANGKTLALGNILLATGSGISAVTRPVTDPLWRTATTTVTIVNNNQLRISNLKTALAIGNRITIRGSTFTDLTLNRNLPLEITLTAADNTAPTISNNNASNIEATTARFSFTSSEPGTYFYLVYPGADPAPNTATIKAQGSAIRKGTAAVGTRTTPLSNTIHLTGLADSTDYRVYVVITDPSGNNSNVATITFRTADTSVPVLSATESLDVTDTAAKFRFTSNEAGTYFYLVYNAADAAPNIAAVKAQGTAIRKGTASAGTTPITISLTGLSVSTAYHAYVVVTDAAGNNSVVSTIAFTTSADATSPTITNVTVVSNTELIWGDFPDDYPTNTISFTSNEAGTFYYRVYSDSPPVIEPSAEGLLMDPNLLSMPMSVGFNTESILFSQATAGWARTWYIYYFGADTTGNKTSVGNKSLVIAPKPPPPPDPPPDPPPG